MNKQLKPALACDFDETKLKFPLLASVKVDGVRGISLNGEITGRSLKKFKNPFVSKMFDSALFFGFDGELVLGDYTSPTLCSDTTGFVNRQTPKDGKPTESDQLYWYVFDCLDVEVIDMPYEKRFQALTMLVNALHENNLALNVRIMPTKMVHSMEELLAFEEECLEAGFEGVIIRDPNGMHKSGRATLKGGTYLRIKRFVDFEGIIESFEEAMENTNEAKTNELGRTERSTHQANMVPKGMVGSLKLRTLQDVVYNGKVLIPKGELVTVGPGAMSHEDRVAYFKNPDMILGKIGKAKFFPKIQKDKLRFPTFLSLRAEEDMSE